MSKDPDINDFHLKYGPDAVRSVLDKSSVPGEEQHLDITPASSDASAVNDDGGHVVDTEETALAAALAAVSGAENEFARLLALRNSTERLVHLGCGDAVDKLAAASISEFGMSFTKVQAAIKKGRGHAKQPQDAPPDPPSSIHKMVPPSEIPSEILKLAKLSPMEYERTRSHHADLLGIRVSALDAFVMAARSKAGGKGDSAGATEEFSEPHWDITPWPEAVSLDELLDDISAVVRRYMVMEEAAIDAHALWTLNTYVRDVFDVAPYAHVSSPIPGCGKSRLMTLTQYMGYRTTIALDTSPPSIFRTIEAAHPVLLLDEVDRFLSKKDDDIIGILNAGYKTSGYVLRMEEVDGKHVPRKFSPFCPKMLAGIGNLPRTLAERSIRIPLQKKKKGQKSTRLRDRDTQEFKGIRARALRWVNDHRARLEEIRDRDEVQFPNALGDRDGETWEPLLAIALLAGEEWQKRAMKAATSLSGASTADDEYGTLLLEHVREIFEAEDTNSIPSKVLLQRLNDNEEWPWRERGKAGKPMSLPAMQSTLKGFNIHVEPEPIRMEKYGKQRGYLRAKFEEAWDTCCKPRSGHNQAADEASSSLAPSLSPSAGCGTVANAHGSGISGDFQGVARTPAATPRKCEEMPVNSTFATVPHPGEGRGDGGQGAAPQNEADLRHANDVPAVAKSNSAATETCGYCGHPGELVEVKVEGRTARLHRHCIDAWDHMVAIQ
jgi:putative DNA primase/helicase